MKMRRLSSSDISYLKAGLASRLDAEFQPEPVVEPQAPRGTSSAPSPAALHLLEVAASDWFRTLTEQYEAALLRADEAKVLVDELRATDYVTVHPVKTFKRGQQIRIMLPTDQAREILRDARVRCAAVRGDAPHGDGDATHIYYQNLIARWLRKKDWTVEIEQTLRAKRVDVGAIRGPVLHAYEIVNEGLEKELANLRDLGDGWHRIVFCIGTEEIQQELAALISDRVGDQILEQVDFRLLPSFR